MSRSEDCSTCSSAAAAADASLGASQEPHSDVVDVGNQFGAADDFAFDAYLIAVQNQINRDEPRLKRRLAQKAEPST